MPRFRRCSFFVVALVYQLIQKSGYRLHTVVELRRTIHQASTALATTASLGRILSHAIAQGATREFGTATEDYNRASNRQMEMPPEQYFLASFLWCLAARSRRIRAWDVSSL